MDEPTLDSWRSRILAESTAVLSATHRTARRDCRKQLARSLGELKARRPAEETRQVVCELLEAPEFQATGSAVAIGLRRQFVAAQLSLGFPWALEVDPSDLALLHHPTGSKPTGGLRVLTCLFAAIAAPWCCGWLMLLLFVFTQNRDPLPWGALVMLSSFAVGLGHALIAFKTASAGGNGGAVNRRTLGILGAMVLVGPLAATLINFASPDRVWWLGMLMATPSMLTAACCGVMALLRPPS